MEDRPETDVAAHDGARWSAADAYERYMGRWSRAIGRDFLVWLDLPSGLRWLDVGCGTGALTSEILRLEESPASEVFGIDASAAFVERAQASTRDGRAHFATGLAGSLPFEREAFDVVVCGLLLNFVPEPAGAIREMVRVARAAGVVASYVWDYLGGMQMLRSFWDAVLARVPAAAQTEEVRRFAICRPKPLSTLFDEAGLEDVEVGAIDVDMRFSDFDDYWSPFLAGQGAAPGYLVSLPEADRLAIEESLRSTLPRNPDGSIELIARAWAVRGRVPQ